MKHPSKALLLRCLIAFLLELVVAMLFAILQGAFSAGIAASERFRILSDGFLIPGIVVLGIAALSAVATTGFFDMLSYGFQNFSRIFLPFVGLKTKKNYYDYKQEKEAKRGRPLTFMFISGAASVLISVTFILLFYAYM